MEKGKREIRTCYSVVFAVAGGVIGLILRACQVFPSDEMAMALPVILLLLVGNVLDIRAAGQAPAGSAGKTDQDKNADGKKKTNTETKAKGNKKRM